MSGWVHSGCLKMERSRETSTVSLLHLSNVLIRLEREHCSRKVDDTPTKSISERGIEFVHANVVFFLAKDIHKKKYGLCEMPSFFLPPPS